MKQSWKFSILVLLLVLTVGCSREEFRQNRKFAVVKEGVLLRSRFPTLSRLEEMKKNYGMKTIVNLLDVNEINQPESQAERKFAEEHGIRFIHLPMGIPNSEQVKEFLTIVNNPVNQPVLVHCQHGTVRTGALVAIYRIEVEGWPSQKALDEMASYGFDLKDPRYKSIVDLVLGYKK